MGNRKVKPEGKDLHILDAGCGTGNYAEELIKLGAGSMSLLDASSGMLERAKCKLSDYIASGIVRDVVESTMPPIPFPDESFDAVMINTVTCHMDQDNPAFPNVVDTLKESVRVLRKNGLVIISPMLSATWSKAVWFTQLNMEFTNRFITSFMPSAEQFEQIFKDAGIECIQKLNILGSDVYKSYYNLDGPLDESWRATESYWSCSTKEEIAQIAQKVKELKA